MLGAAKYDFVNLQIGFGSHTMWILTLSQFVEFVACKGNKMGPLLVLVSPCSRENVNVTCKIVSFLCSLDNFLLKNAIFFFEIKFQNGTHLEKKHIFYLLFTFFSHQGKTQKFLQYISHLHTYTYFAHPIGLFCLPNFAKKCELSCMVSLWCDFWY